MGGGHMTRSWIALSLSALALVSLAPVSVSTKVSDDSGSDARIEEDFVPSVNSSQCAAGCAALPDDREELGQVEFGRLLKECARSPLDGDNLALETLLFHGAQTLAYLDAPEGVGAADPLRDLLARELARDHVRLEVRVTDRSGAIRIALQPVVVPLGIKQHLHADQAQGLDAPEISGTIKRVGLRHLWARF